MQLDPDTRDRFAEQLALLTAVRDEMRRTPPAEIADPLDHALALRALDADIARYRAALGA